MLELLIASQAFLAIGFTYLAWQLSCREKDISVLSQAVSVLQHKRRKPEWFTNDLCQLDRRLDSLEHPGEGDMTPMTVPIYRRK